MRRPASVGLLAVAFLVLPVGSLGPGTARAAGCSFNPENGTIECTASGGSPGSGGGGSSRSGPRVPLDPVRYLHVGVDPVVGGCASWSRNPGGIDTWDPVNDPFDIPFFVGLPLCPGGAASLSAAEVEAVAWAVFLAFPLAVPDPVFEPPEPGITGLPTYLSVTDPEVITHAQTLPDGRELVVRAAVADLSVAWGDGQSDAYPPETAAPYPEGAATHTYTLKTCSADYRAEHPSGGLCHPTLEAYAVSTAFTWAGEFSIGGSTTSLGTLDLVTDVTYDVDEVQGVLQP